MRNVTNPGVGSSTITVSSSSDTAATSPQYTIGGQPPPSISSVNPSSGPQAAATPVTITGANLSGATAVKFGASAATNVVVNGAGTQITANAPAGAAGTVDVRVTTSAGTSTIVSADKFTYVAPPAVTGVSPSSGPLAAGTPVTITGANLSGATAVKFGASAATNVVVNGAGTQITANAPAGAAGTVDVTVITPGGTSATSASDQYTYTAPAPPPPAAPVVSGVSPSSGPAAGGSTVAITGSAFTGATAVHFGASAAPFTVVSDTQITATAPAGSGTVDVTVTTGAGTSAIGAGDQFTFVSPPPPTAPVPSTGPPTATGSKDAGFAGTVNPEGLQTAAHFEYGLDAKYRAPGDTAIYDQRTPDQTVGSDSSPHSVTASVTGLVPNAVYHVRLVATNAAGTISGQDKTFMTAADVAPLPVPKLGKTVNIRPLTGLVFIKLPGPGAASDRGLTKGAGFMPLTEARQLPSGTKVDSRFGSLRLIAAAASSQHIGKTQSVTLSSGLFGLTQARTGINKGLTTFSLLEGDFAGAPSYAGCGHAAADSTGVFAHAAISRRILQTLHASGHGRFRTRGRYSAGTVRGTVWDTTDRCDGTLTVVRRGTVAVTDFRLRKTIPVHAGHSYLARFR